MTTRPRPVVRGKFLFVGDEKLYVRGVSYGAFKPDEQGLEYHDLEQVERDFAAIRALGCNAIRIPHTTPPRELLDIAQRYDLWVMVGLSAEQYVGYLNDRHGPDIGSIIREKVRAIAGHPALLCYAVGNEIPARTVRWFGRKRIERYIERIYRAVKDEDPDGLVTYVNYPSTEYLRLPFLDFVAFNLYLERRDELQAYLPRLHNVVGDDRPLFVSEVGLDSLRNGDDVQAESLEWQIRACFAGGAGGVFVFAWTDEWYRGEMDVVDWAFGITDRERRPKPALDAVRRAFAEVPFPGRVEWPSVSVVICSYNAEGTLRGCLDGVSKLRYPDFEVIVVDDGSTDGSAAIAAEYGVRLIRTATNEGLGSARNTGLEAAAGEIVAYLDSDARADPDWLQYLAWTLMTNDYAGVGGPNLPVPEDGLVADCVANSPGAPSHVLLSDTEAEHIPGCNMAFLRSALEKVEGFDPRFRTAGDDVDLCWRLQEAGGHLGFNPAAVVWHHRRSSIRSYWKQQQGYGRAEALLESKWPERYNSVGHVRWSGRLYGAGLPYRLGRVQRVYHGGWGTAPFQSLYERDRLSVLALPLVPEWWFVIAALAAVSAASVLWRPALLATPLLALAVGALLVQAASGARNARFASRVTSRRQRFRLRCITAALHLVQPIARLHGRLLHGLRPWRRHGRAGFAVPIARRYAIWSELWEDPAVRLRSCAEKLRAVGSRVIAGGNYDRWDLQVLGGVFGSMRVMLLTEDHPKGTQYVRIRVWPHVGRLAIAITVVLLVLTGTAASSGSSAALLFGLGALVCVGKTLADCGVAAAALERATGRFAGREGS